MRSLTLLVISLVLVSKAQEPPSTDSTLVNPWLPVRPGPPTRNNVVKKYEPSHFQTYRFVVNDFLIVMGCVFAAMGLIVAFIVFARRMRNKTSSDEFDQEQTALAKRISSVRRVRVADSQDTIDHV